MRPYLTTLFLTASLVAPLAPLSAQQTIDGWRVTMTMTVDSGNGRSHATTSRRIVADGMLRNEFSSSDTSAAGRMAGGSFMVVNAHDSTVVSVMPSQQMATITPSAFVGDVALELPTVASHTTSITRTDLGPGEKILGHDTRHYRVTSSGSIDATMYGKTCTREVNGSSEMWIAPDIDVWPMLEMQARAYGPAMAARVDSVRKAATAGGDAAFASGLPLRTRRTETFKDSTGQEHTIVMTMEYSEYEHGPLDRSLFEIPPGYRVMDMRSMPAMTRERVIALTRSRPNPLCPTGR